MNRQLSLFICASALGLSFGQVGLAQPGPSDPVCDTGGEEKPQFCLRYDNLDDPPVENTDFTFDFSDPDNPGVTFLTGSDESDTRIWRVWSWDDDTNQTPRNIGTLTASNDWNYEVLILQPDGDPGADDLASVDLDNHDAGNFSSILNGELAGDLLTQLSLQRSTGDEGGTANMIIGGNLVGDLDIYGVDPTSTQDEFIVEGDVVGPSTINLENGRRVSFQGNVDGDGGRTITLNVAEISNGTFQIGLEVHRFVTINIAEMASTATFKSGYLANNDDAMEAIVNFGSDLPSGAVVDMSKVLIGAFGDLRFGTNDIGGTITIYRLSGDVVARDLAGTVDIKTEFEESASLDLSGSMSGTFRVNTNEGSSNNYFMGDVRIDGNMTGSALIKHFQGADGVFNSFAFIEVNGASGIGSSASIVLEGNVIGDITVDDDLEGDILIGGDQTSSSSVITLGGIASTGVIQINGDANGSTHVTGNAAGDIIVGLAAVPADLGASGTIDIDGTLTGDLLMTRDVLNNTSAASLTVDTLGAGGRIFIDRRCYDDILIDKGTADTSLIQIVEGLNSGTQVVVNNSQGEYDATGDIFIGDPDTYCGTCSLVTVVYDGIIRVREFSSGGDGDLDGDLTVVGCHTSQAELELCVDGDINGTVTIYQSGCQEQVPGYTCTP